MSTSQVSDLVSQEVQGEGFTSNLAQLRRLQQYLGVAEVSEDDLHSLEERRVEGSCMWLEEREDFQRWRDNRATTSSAELGEKAQFYCISGPPATGKSVLAAHAINHLQSRGSNCAYYFFCQGDRTKRRSTALLRSIAYQMAVTSSRIRENLICMEEDGISVDKSDCHAIWQKIYRRGVFAGINETYYWVIDALDECNDYIEILPLLARMNSTLPIQVYISSRHFPELEKHFGPLGTRVISVEIPRQDTLADIRRYLVAHGEDLPAGNDQDRSGLIDKILTKSAGNFLWVALVHSELANAFSSKHVGSLLEELPVQMEHMYMRIVDGLLSRLRSGEIFVSRAILTWVVCSTRPLRVIELELALRLESELLVVDLKRTIMVLCANLVFIDKHDTVHLVHQTVRSFLFNLTHSMFAVDRCQAHWKLAVVCIKYLGSREMQPPTRKLLSSKKIKKSEFADYASTAFSEHMVYADVSSADELLRLVSKFLSSNTLTWIEYVSRKGSLQDLIRTAKNLKYYLARLTKYSASIVSELSVVAGWAVDLNKLVSKFGGVLLSSPQAIYYSVPPFCPPLSRIHQEFARSANGIMLNGLSARSWDDCISCVDYQESRISALGNADAAFAVGLVSGTILLYNASSCQVERTLCHSEPVKLLAFGKRGELLLSCGIISIKLWDAWNGAEIWTRHLTSPAIALSFQCDTILVVLKTRHVLWVNCDDGTLKSDNRCMEESSSNELRLQRVPVKAAISFDNMIIALMYKEGSICLYDLESGRSIGSCTRYTKENEPSLSTQMALPNRTSDGPLAVVYEDGCLVTYDLFTLEHKASVAANAVSLALAQNDLTLAVGNSRGAVQIRDFATLLLLYNIESYGFEPNSLLFSDDGLQLIGVRDYRLRIWEPAVLLERQMENEQESLSVEMSTKSNSPTNVSEVTKGDITAVATHPLGKVIFVGKSDGSVSMYESRTGKELACLYSHDKAIMLLLCDGNVLTSTDVGSSIVMSELAEDDEKQLTTTRSILAGQSTGPVEQLLLSPDGTVLLVSTARSDVLWATKTGQRMTSLSSPPRAVWKWVSSPTQGSLILIADAEIRVYRWDEASKSATAPYRRLSFNPGFISEDTRIKMSVINGQGSYLAVEYSRDLGTKTATSFQVLNTTDLAPSTEGSHQLKSDAVAIPLFATLSKRIKCFLGFHHSNLVFMDNHSWLCSVDLRTFTGTHYVQHFFVPYDFVSGNKGVVAVVMPSGDIAFAKERELAIVRNGLKFSIIVNL